MRIGIDASNIRAGGGLTHLSELLRAAQPGEQGITQVTVWGGRRTLGRLPSKPWLVLAHEPLLNGSLPRRLLWQQVRLPQLAKAACEMLFVPGGTYLGQFKPFTAMSQNLLPFELAERQRFGLSWTRLKLWLLEKSQTATFRRAAGIIFLTETARQIVERQAGPLSGQVAIVSHGIVESWRRKPKAQDSITQYTISQPFRLLYVSVVAPYKHQWHVVEAVARLRQEGIPLVLELVGPAYPTALRRLQAIMARIDPKTDFIHYRGPAAYSELASYYHQADGFVFASSCENMPIILLEAMAAGLPIACSDRGPMPEVLGDAGVYFDPERPGEIAAALYALVEDPDLRGHLAWSAYRRAEGYSWKRCARETLAFLAQAAQTTESRQGNTS